MGWEWELIRQECTGCGICADVCPHAAIAMTRQMAYPEPVPEKCVGCLDCVRECPVDAIRVRNRVRPGSRDLAAERRQEVAKGVSPWCPGDPPDSRAPGVPPGMRFGFARGRAIDSVRRELSIVLCTAPLLPESACPARS